MGEAKDDGGGGGGGERQGVRMCVSMCVWGMFLCMCVCTYVYECGGIFVCVFVYESRCDYVGDYVWG